jgi:hypothetical protein
MTGAVVFSTCVSFVVEASVQSSDRFLGMYGFGKPASHHTPSMLLGFEDSDGNASTNLPGRRTGLHANGGSSSGLHGKQGLTLTPVPPPGPLHIYFAWPHFGIEEVRHTVDATQLAVATDRVQTLWPLIAPENQPHVDINDGIPTEIEIPDGGWFAAAFESQKPPPRDPNGPRRINFAIDDTRESR